MVIIISTKRINDPFAVNNKPMKNSLGLKPECRLCRISFYFFCIFVTLCPGLAVTNKLIKNSESEVCVREPECRLKNCRQNMSEHNISGGECGQKMII